MAQISEEHIHVRGAVDVERTRRAAQVLTRRLGFSRLEQEVVTLSVSELATNLIRYAIDGVIVLRPTVGPKGTGVEVQSRDHGPGITETQAGVPAAQRARSLRAGLPAVRRLMDEFELNTAPSGTIVVCRKWRSLP